MLKQSISILYLLILFISLIINQLYAQNAPLLDEDDAFDSIALDYKSGDAMIAADIDGDGDEDFIVATHPRGPPHFHLYRYFNDGNGNFKRDKEPFMRISSDYNIAPSMIPIHLYKNDKTVSIIISARDRGSPLGHKYLLVNDGKGNFSVKK